MKFYNATRRAGASQRRLRLGSHRRTRGPSACVRQSWKGIGTASVVFRVLTSQKNDQSFITFLYSDLQLLVVLAPGGVRSVFLEASLCANKEISSAELSLPWPNLVVKDRKFHANPYGFPCCFIMPRDERDQAKGSYASARTGEREAKNRNIAVRNHKFLVKPYASHDFP